MRDDQQLKGNIRVFVAVELLKSRSCERKSQRITSVIKIHISVPHAALIQPIEPEVFHWICESARDNRLLKKKKAAMSLGFTVWVPWIYEPKFKVIHLILCLVQSADGEAKNPRSL